MRRLAGLVLCSCAEWTGLNALFRFLNRNRAVILMYHGVCDDGFTLLNGYDERHTPRRVFRRQVLFLKHAGYRFVTLSELVERIRRNQSIRNLAVLTFDDGFRNVVRNAYPIMRELGAKGCIFVVSGFIESGGLLWTDLVETYIRAQPPGRLTLPFPGGALRYELNSPQTYETAMRNLKEKLRSLDNAVRVRWMDEQRMTRAEIVRDAPAEFAPADWRELAALDPAILEIGSHTQNHPNCDTIDSPWELEEEIAGSKSVIERRLGWRVGHFCYPAGAFNNAVIDKVRGAGFESAVTTVEGFAEPGADLYRLKRVVGDNDLLRFKATISGSLPWLQRSLGHWRAV